jgi:hypothetical protein
LDFCSISLHTLLCARRSAKKYDEARDAWQARVNRSWRFYLVIRGDEYVILSIIPHPK